MRQTTRLLLLTLAAAMLLVLVPGPANAANQAPVCTGSGFTASASSGIGPVSITAPSCSDADGDTLTGQVVAQPAHRDQSARYSVANHSITYTPTYGYAGTDSIEVRVVDEHGAASNPITIAISVTDLSFRCEATVDSIEVRPGGDTFANATDCRANGAYAVWIDGPSGAPDPAIATVELAEGTLAVHGVAEGTTSVRVLARHEWARFPIAATVPIVVSATVNHAPSCSVYGRTLRAGTSHVLPVWCWDEDGDEVTIAIDEDHEPQLGTIDLAGAPDFVEYTAGDTLGQSIIRFVAIDSRGATSSFDLTNQIVHATTNVAPVCSEEPVTVFAGGDRDVYASCNDAEGDPLTYEVLQQPAVGSVAVHASGDRFAYAVPVMPAGETSFTFRAMDDRGASTTVVQQLVVVPDTTQPFASVEFTRAPTGTTRTTSAIAEFTGGGPDATIDCSLDGAHWLPCASQWTTTALAAGSHQLRVRARDSNHESVAEQMWNVDPSSNVAASVQATAGARIDTGAVGSITLGITSPTSGTVAVSQLASGAAPAGYSVLGTTVQVAAPAATSAVDPVRLTFTLAAREIPAGTDATTIRVVRNGAPVTAACAGDTAVPSPCERSRTTLGNGDLQITVLTMQVSAWVFAKADPVIAPVKTTPDTPRPPVDPAPPSDPEPPIDTKVATRLTGATARVQQYTCAQRDRRRGVRAGRRVICFRLVAAARLVRADGRAVAGQRVQVARLVRARRVPLATVRTDTRGSVRLTRAIVVPSTHRASRARATRWIASQYAHVQLRHTATGPYSTATVVTIRTRR